LESTKLVIGKLVDNKITFKQVTISKDVEWLKWLDPEELAEFTKHLLMLISKIASRRKTIGDLELFISEWHKTALIYHEIDSNDISVELEVSINNSGRTRKHLFEVVIEPDEDAYQAYCPDLPGCQTWGHTKAETLRYIKEAVELYLYDLIADGKPIPNIGLVKAKPSIRLIKTEKVAL